MPSRSIHIVANGRIYFLMAVKYSTLSLSIHPSMNIQVVSLSWLLQVMLQWMGGGVQISLWDRDIYIYICVCMYIYTYMCIYICICIYIIWDHIRREGNEILNLITTRRCGHCDHPILLMGQRNSPITRPPREGQTWDRTHQWDFTGMSPHCGKIALCPLPHFLTQNPEGACLNRRTYQVSNSTVNSWHGVEGEAFNWDLLLKSQSYENNYTWSAFEPNVGFN